MSLVDWMSKYEEVHGSKAIDGRYTPPFPMSGYKHILNKMRVEDDKVEEEGLFDDNEWAKIGR
jgi:hypothetical protein